MAARCASSIFDLASRSTSMSDICTRLPICRSIIHKAWIANARMYIDQCIVAIDLGIRRFAAIDYGIKRFAAMPGNTAMQKQTQFICMRTCTRFDCSVCFSDLWFSLRNQIWEISRVSENENQRLTHFWFKNKHVFVWMDSHVRGMRRKKLSNHLKKKSNGRGNLWSKPEIVWPGPHLRDIKFEKSVNCLNMKILTCMN